MTPTSCTMLLTVTGIRQVTTCTQLCVCCPPRPSHMLALCNTPGLISCCFSFMNEVTSTQTLKRGTLSPHDKLS